MTFAEAEMAWCSVHRKVRIFKHCSCMVDNGTKIHPTQKPVELYAWLLNNYAKEGDKILDTHGGSMSHAIAAHDLGFELTIIEKDDEYYAKAKERLVRHQQQLTFDF